LFSIFLETNEYIKVYAYYSKYKKDTKVIVMMQIIEEVPLLKEELRQLRILK